MYLCENKRTIITLGPIATKDGKPLNQKRLLHDQVMYSLNGNSLAKFEPALEIPVDWDGFYKVPMPGQKPGNLVIVVMVTGYPAKAFEHTILSEQGHARMFGDKLEEVNAVNVPIKDGHVVTDPNLTVGVDFGKALGLDAPLRFPNMHIGSVQEVAKPHVTDLRPVIDAVNTKGATMATAQVVILESIEHLADALEKLDTILEQAQASIGHQQGVEAALKMIGGVLDGLDKSDPRSELDAMTKCIKGLGVIIDEAKITPEEIGKCVGDKVRQLATLEVATHLAAMILNMSKVLDSLNIPTVEQITGGGALDTKDGRMRVAAGTEDGELLIGDGLVSALDVKHKAGYSLARKGLEAMHSEITNMLKDIQREITTTLRDEIKKKHAGRHH